MYICAYNAIDKFLPHNISITSIIITHKVSIYHWHSITRKHPAASLMHGTPPTSSFSKPILEQRGIFHPLFYFKNTLCQHCRRNLSSEQVLNKDQQKNKTSDTEQITASDKIKFSSTKLYFPYIFSQFCLFINICIHLLGNSFILLI